MAANTMQTLETAPAALPNSNALDVPAPCELVPNNTPLAISLLNRKIRMIHGPSIIPIIPVIITNTAVIVGTPPIFEETPIAIGVVIE